MLTSTLGLMWQLHQQEKHTTQQMFLRWIQGLLMVFIVTLSQTSDNIQAFLSNNLNSLLGADVVIAQSHALTPAQMEALRALSHQVVITQQITTTLTHEGRWQRAQLKVVDDDYPLQGELKVTSAMGGAETSLLRGPAPGQIWLDSRLLASLSVSLGDTLMLMNRPLKVTRILQHEPDRLMEGHSVEMRALIHVKDFQQMALPEARIQHRYLIAAHANGRESKSVIEQIVDWQKAHLPAAQIHHKQGAHPLALFWQRTENFIGLASLILFFMSVIAIEQLTHLQLKKEQHFSAVCMSLGASKRAAFALSVGKWVLRSVSIMPLVLLVSAGAHGLLIQWLGNTFADLHWQWNGMLALQSLLTLSLILFVFQLPVWVGLWHSSVAKLVNQHQHSRAHRSTLVAGLVVLSGVAWAYSDNGLLTAMVLLSLLVSVVLILFLSWLALTLGESLTKNVSGLMPFALYMMKQRIVSKSTQILGVGLCAFLLLFTLMLLNDLGDTMTRYQRQHDGNLLVSQASDAQMRDVVAWAEQHQAEIRMQKPYVYASLTQVNGLGLGDFASRPSESLDTFKRPIRLHWSKTVPSNNRIVNGQWWGKHNAPEAPTKPTLKASSQYRDSLQRWQQVSVEQEVMTDLGLTIGDKLTLMIAQQAYVFQISASHAYKPGKGSITFWVQMPSEAIAHISAPHYTMASLEVTPQSFPRLGALWQKHPSLRMVSLQEMTARFDTTLAMVTQVISAFSVLIIVVASIVILASIHAFESKEKQKNSIIQSFGFTQKTCLTLNVIEWGITGLIAAIGAILGTYIAGLLIYQSQFSLVYQPSLLWLLGTVSVILLGVTALGVIASKNSLKSSIRALMAES